MKGLIKRLLSEGLNNEVIEQYVSIIDGMDKSNPRREEYIQTLKSEYGYDYVDSNIRYERDNKLIEKYIGVKKVVTTKGVSITMHVDKTPNLHGSLTMSVYDDNGNNIANAGYGIDLENKTMRVGGVTVREEDRRKGIYSAMMDEIERISIENNLKMVEGGRSEDAKNFWKSRN